MTKLIVNDMEDGLLPPNVTVNNIPMLWPQLVEVSPLPPQITVKMPGPTLPCLFHLYTQRSFLPTCVWLFPHMIHIYLGN